MVRNFVGVAQQEHAEAHPEYDEVADVAIGGHSGELPRGYYWSLNFWGTLIVVAGNPCKAPTGLTIAGRHAWSPHGLYGVYPRSKRLEYH